MADVIPLDTTAAIFGQGGALARSFPGYAPRDGQVAMARPMELVESYVGKHRRAPREVIVARFWANLTKSDGCWTWTGPLSPYGYALLRTGGRGAYVLGHRLSYELHHGPIPAGTFVCHRCDVRACVNPDHLFLGTGEDNRRDMVEKGRNARGERAGGAKLTEATAADAIAALGSGEHPRSVAARLGVSRAAIYSILRGENWRHLPRPACLPAPMSRRERAASGAA